MSLSPILIKPSIDLKPDGKILIIYITGLQDKNCPPKHADLIFFRIPLKMKEEK